MTKILYEMYEIAPANQPEPNTTKVLYGMYSLAEKPDEPAIDNNQEETTK